MITLKSGLIISVAFCSSVVCLKARENDAPMTKNEQKPMKEQVFSYKRVAGTYKFTVTEQAALAGCVTITSMFEGIEGGRAGSIKEEADAVSELLAELKKSNLKVTHYYIPWSYQTEVIERIQPFAINSPEWTNKKPINTNRVLIKLIEQSEAYKELLDVLRRNENKNFKIGVEKVFVEQKPGLKVKVPVAWTTFISTEN